MLIVKDGTKNEEGGEAVGVPNYSAQPCFGPNLIPSGCLQIETPNE